jgi:hypothetical protein
MHEVVANFLCKLLDMPAFSHLQERLQEPTAKEATGNWILKTKASKKITEWCQDQWRRKEFRFPEHQAAYTVNEPSTMPWFENIPVCYKCATPCPECREELSVDITNEIPTAHAILSERDIESSSDEEISYANRDENVADLSPPICKRLRSGR